MKAEKNKSAVIAVDFDGTVVTHNYPEVGMDVPCAINVLKALQQRGHRLILLTNRDSKTIGKAIQWFEKNEIKLWAINRNPDQEKHTDSRKVYADVIIDDHCAGIPLISKKPGKDIKYLNNLYATIHPHHEVELCPDSKHPYVDWLELNFIFIKMGLYNGKYKPLIW